MPSLGQIPGVSSAVSPSPGTTSFPSVSTFTLASLTFPGKWTLVEATKEFGWQIQKGYALDGAFVIPTGDPLVVAKFKGEFWSQSDFAIFRQYRKQLFQKGAFTPGGSLIAAAMGIDHPELKDLGVTYVVVLKHTPAKDDGGGLWSVTVDFLQYRAPAKAVPKPTQKIPDVAPPTPDAKTNQQIEEQKLDAQASGLLSQFSGLK